MNQRRRGRKVTSVSTNVKSIVHRPRVLEVLFSRDLTETASSESETQGQSVGSGEKVRRKFPRMPKPETAHEKPLAPRVRVL